MLFRSCFDPVVPVISADPPKVFPKHDDGGWTLIHRPDEEICLSAWYEADENYWTLPDDWNDSIDNKKFTVELFEDILNKLYKKYTA